MNAPNISKISNVVPLMVGLMAACGSNMRQVEHGKDPIAVVSDDSRSGVAVTLQELCALRSKSSEAPKLTVLAETVVRSNVGKIFVVLVETFEGKIEARLFTKRPLGKGFSRPNLMTLDDPNVPCEFFGSDFTGTSMGMLNELFVGLEMASTEEILERWDHVKPHILELLRVRSKRKNMWKSSGGKKGICDNGVSMDALARFRDQLDSLPGRLKLAIDFATKTNPGGDPETDSHVRRLRNEQIRLQNNRRFRECDMTAKRFGIDPNWVDH